MLKSPARYSELFSAQSLAETGMFVLMVGMATLVRVQLQYLPNFAPVAAVSLFAGYYFRHWLPALLVAPCVMLASDHFIGGYEFSLMLIVYSALTLPAALRPVLKRMVDWNKAGRSFLLISGGAIAGSLIFFAATNLGVWWVYTQHSAAELGATFWRALPFLRFTLGGDLCFAAILFGGYALAWKLAQAGESSVATVQ